MQIHDDLEGRQEAPRTAHQLTGTSGASLRGLSRAASAVSTFVAADVGLGIQAEGEIAGLASSLHLHGRRPSVFVGSRGEPGPVPDPPAREAPGTGLFARSGPSLVGRE